jgi:hypothetical protein
VPLGSERLKICELFAEILHLQYLFFSSPLFDRLLAVEESRLVELSRQQEALQEYEPPSQTQQQEPLQQQQPLFDDQQQHESKVENPVHVSDVDSSVRAAASVPLKKEASGGAWDLSESVAGAGGEMPTGTDEGKGAAVSEGGGGEVSKVVDGATVGGGLGSAGDGTKDHPGEEVSTVAGESGDDGVRKTGTYENDESAGGNNNNTVDELTDKIHGLAVSEESIPAAVVASMKTLVADEVVLATEKFVDAKVLPMCLVMCPFIYFYFGFIRVLIFMW